MSNNQQFSRNNRARPRSAGVNGIPSTGAGASSSAADENVSTGAVGRSSSAPSASIGGPPSPAAAAAEGPLIGGIGAAYVSTWNDAVAANGLPPADPFIVPGRDELELTGDENDVLYELYAENWGHFRTHYNNGAHYVRADYNFRLRLLPSLRIQRLHRLFRLVFLAEPHTFRLNFSFTFLLRRVPDTDEEDNEDYQPEYRVFLAHANNNLFFNIPPTITDQASMDEVLQMLTEQELQEFCLRERDNTRWVFEAFLGVSIFCYRQPIKNAKGLPTLSVHNQYEIPIPEYIRLHPAIKHFLVDDRGGRQVESKSALCFFRALKHHKAITSTNIPPTYEERETGALELYEQFQTWLVERGLLQQPIPVDRYPGITERELGLAETLFRQDVQVWHLEYKEPERRRMGRERNQARQAQLRRNRTRRRRRNPFILEEAEEEGVCSDAPEESDEEEEEEEEEEDGEYSFIDDRPIMDDDDDGGDGVVEEAARAELREPLLADPIYRELAAHVNLNHPPDEDETIPNECIAKTIRFSGKRYTSADSPLMHLLEYGDHYFYVRDPGGLARRFQCQHCRTIFAAADTLRRHKQGHRPEEPCPNGGQTKRVWPGGSASKRMDIFQELALHTGINVPPSLRFYDFKIVYDCETYYPRSPEEADRFGAIEPRDRPVEPFNLQCEHDYEGPDPTPPDAPLPLIPKSAIKTLLLRGGDPPRTVADWRRREWSEIRSDRSRPDWWRLRLCNKRRQDVEEADETDQFPCTIHALRQHLLYMMTKTSYETTDKVTVKDLRFTFCVYDPRTNSYQTVQTKDVTGRIFAIRNNDQRFVALDSVVLDDWSTAGPYMNENLLPNPTTLAERLGIVVRSLGLTGELLSGGVLPNIDIVRTDLPSPVFPPRRNNPWRRLVGLAAVECRFDCTQLKYIYRLIPLSVCVQANFGRFRDQPVFLYNKGPELPGDDDHEAAGARLVDIFVENCLEMAEEAERLAELQLRPFIRRLDKLLAIVEDKLNNLPEASQTAIEEPGTQRHPRKGRPRHGPRPQLTNRLQMLQHLRYKLTVWMRQVPILGFNSGSFDLNVFRYRIFPRLLETAVDKGDERSIQCFVRAQKYLAAYSERLLWLDARSYTSPCSYKGFLEQWGITDETKLDFCYEFPRKPADLLLTLDDLTIDSWQSWLRNTKRTAEEYRLIRKDWLEKGYENLLALLRAYNIADVTGLLKACDKLAAFWRERFNLDAFKGGYISLPGLAYASMLKSIPKFTIFHCFESKYAFLYDKLQANLVAGPSIIYNRLAVKDQTKVADRVSPVKRIYGYDANSLYASCFLEDLPYSIPIYYSPINRNLDGEDDNQNADNEPIDYENLDYENDMQTTLFKSESTASYWRLSCEWMAFETHDFERLGKCKDHKPYGRYFSGREIRLGGRSVPVDGVCDSCMTIFQFHGCYWHGHDDPACKYGKPNDPARNPKYAANLLERQKRTKSVSRYLNSLKLYKVIEKYECEWRKIKETNVNEMREWYAERGPRPKADGSYLGPDNFDIAKFCRTLFPYYKMPRNNHSNAVDIVNAVQSGKFTGFVEIDIRVKKEHRAVANLFPPIFKHRTVTVDQLNPPMSEYVRARKKIPEAGRKMLVSALSAKKWLVSTVYARYLVSHCFCEITKVYSAIYYPMRPICREFIAELLAERKRAADSGNVALATAIKLILNSIYGRCCIRKEKFTNTFICTAERALKLVNDRRFRKMDVVADGEYYQVSLQKPKTIMDTPLQIAIAILSRAKLDLLQFVYEFLLPFLHPKISILFIDTDSVYFAGAADTLEGHVDADKMDAFLTAEAKFLVMTPEEKSMPHKWKLETIADIVVFVATSSKCYYYGTLEGFINKVKCKGLNGALNPFNVQQFLHAVLRQTTTYGTNRGFKMDTKVGRMYVYVLTKLALDVRDESWSTIHPVIIVVVSEYMFTFTRMSSTSQQRYPKGFSKSGVLTKLDVKQFLQQIDKKQTSTTDGEKLDKQPTTKSCVGSKLVLNYTYIKTRLPPNQSSAYDVDFPMDDDEREERDVEKKKDTANV